MSEFHAYIVQTSPTHFGLSEFWPVVYHLSPVHTLFNNCFSHYFLFLFVINYDLWCTLGKYGGVISCCLLQNFEVIIFLLLHWLPPMTRQPSLPCYLIAGSRETRGILVFSKGRVLKWIQQTGLGFEFWLPILFAWYQLQYLHISKIHLSMSKICTIPT